MYRHQKSMEWRIKKFLNDLPCAAIKAHGKKEKHTANIWVCRMPQWGTRQIQGPRAIAPRTASLLCTIK